MALYWASGHPESAAAGQEITALTTIPSASGAMNMDIENKFKIYVSTVDVQIATSDGGGTPTPADPESWE